MTARGSVACARPLKISRNIPACPCHRFRQQPCPVPAAGGGWARGRLTCLRGRETTSRLTYLPPPPKGPPSRSLSAAPPRVRYLQVCSVSSERCTAAFNFIDSLILSFFVRLYRASHTSSEGGVFYAEDRLTRRCWMLVVRCRICTPVFAFKTLLHVF